MKIYQYAHGSRSLTASERFLVMLLSPAWAWKAVAYALAYLAAGCWFLGYKLPMQLVSSVLKWPRQRYLRLGMVTLYRRHWTKIVGVHLLGVIALVLVPLVAKLWGERILAFVPTWFDVAFSATTFVHLGLALGVAFAASQALVEQRNNSLDSQAA